MSSRISPPIEALEPRLLYAVPGEDPSLVAWFAAGSISAGSGVRVGVWNDSSLNGNHAVQAESGRRPVFVEDAIGTRPAVRFDAGSSTQLAFPRAVNGDFTVMVVFRSTQGVGNRNQWFTGAGLVDGEVAGVTRDFGLSLNGVGQVLSGTGQPDATAVSGLGFDDGRPHVATFTRSLTSGAMSLYVDGKLFGQATGGPGFLNAPPRLVIGSLQTNVNYFSGDIADVRLYSSVLPATTRAGVEARLAATYGIAAAAARTFVNPVVNANFPDPGVTKVGSTYLAYATNTGGRNVPMRRSTDLVSWTAATEVLPVLPDWARPGRTWAPDVELMADGVHYNLYFTAWSSTSDRQHIGVARATTPLGPFTPVGDAPLVAQSNLGGAIDASVFVESDGTRYLLWKNDGNAVGQATRIYVQRLSNDGLTLVGSATPLIRNDQGWEGSVVEAPEVVKREGRYYLFYSAGSFGDGSYSIGYAVADSLLGPYVKPAGGPWVGTINNVVGPGGQSFTVGPDGETWMLYHSWENNFGYRSMSVDKVMWEGGVPVLRGPSRARQAVPTFVRAAPVLAAARTEVSGSYASGSLTSLANSNVTVQFFTEPGAEEPVRAFVGGAVVRTDSAGRARFVDVPLARVRPGQSLTAVATDHTGEGSAHSTAIAVRWTGDINADGEVDFDDLAVLAQRYNGPANPSGGDINGDGLADFTDLALLAQNYNTTAAVFATAPAGVLDRSDAGVLQVVEKPAAHRPAKRPRTVRG